MYNLAYKLVEKNWVPDKVLRYFIRKLCKQRLRDETLKYHNIGEKLKWVEELKNSPIAIETDKANEQHYEVPARFYQLTLGKNLKYSSSLFADKSTSLDEAESKMLELYCERAEVKDGMDILDMGCGWGSLSLHLAKKFPNASITGISNSASQREFILKKTTELGLNNVNIITANINDFEINSQFDRVMSVEMLEHVRNYQILFKRVNKWLRSDGKVFIHIFCHKEVAYPFEVHDDSDWMSKYFFTGGQMPALNLFYHFQDHLKIVQKWKVSGLNYSLTSERWLDNIDKNKEEILEIFKDVYGAKEAMKWFVYWRVFFMSCAELFGYKNGEEWLVGHYLMEKKK